MPTPNFNLPLYTTGDTAALDTLLNGQSNAIDTALATNMYRLGGTDTARSALAAPKLKEGLQFRTTDTDREWIYDGTTWLSAEVGSYLIRPTLSSPPAGVSVDSTGALVFNAVAAGAVVDVNNLFSSRFENYRAVAQWNSKPNGATTTVAGTIAGTPAGGTSYSRTWQSVVSGTRNDNQEVTQPNFHECFVPLIGFASSAVSEILTPYLPFPTFILSTSAGVGGVTSIRQEEACLNSTDQLTGLRITLGTGGTFTGRVKFYGLT